MWFKRKVNTSQQIINPDSIKELFWDNEKITQITNDGTKQEMYYQNIIRVEVIILDAYLPTPKWVIQDDTLDNNRVIAIPNDFKTEFMDLVIGMFNKKLDGYDNDEVHKKIIEAMGSTLGLFHLWYRDDADEVLAEMRKRYKPIMDAEIDLIIEQHQQKKANVWWRKILRYLKLIK